METSAKLTFILSLSLLSLSAFAGPANTIVVAKLGGDFTSIQLAIESTSATADNPVLIKVMPGTYEELVSLKSNISLEGSGMDITIIKNTPPPLARQCIVALIGDNVTVSNLTIAGKANSEHIGICGSTGTVKGVKITGNYVGIKGNDGPVDTGILVLLDNVITGNGYAAEILYESVIALRNKIYLNTVRGLFVGKVLVQYNEINRNVGFDINVAIFNNINNAVTSNVSFNTTDNVVGKTVPGLYNVKSDGTALRLP